MTKETIGHTICRLRKEKKRTIVRLSEESGVSAAEIGAIERGVRKAQSATITKLVAALGCDISELY